MSFWSSMKNIGNLVIGSNKYEGKNNWNNKMGKFTDLNAIDIDGKEMNFNVFDGKVLLITNVACKCGYTKASYDIMQQYATKYESKGLRILCFPCNQFLSQEPWPEKEIKEWVTGKWPKLNPILFSKIEVNGDNTHKVYKFLKTCFPGDINWNFATKFVVGPDGIPVQRFDKNQKWELIEQCIQKQLETAVVTESVGVDDNKNDDKNVDDEKKNDEMDKKDENVNENADENVDKGKDKKDENVNINADENVDENKDVNENVDKDKGKEDNVNDKPMTIVTKEYVYKSIDKDNNKITCLDNEFNDIVFDLDVENKDLLEKINKAIEDGQNDKKDVKIIVSVFTKDDTETQTVSDVKIE